MSKQVQLEILDHLRPYLRAIYNVSPNTSTDIDLFSSDNYAVARFMLNKCFNSTVSDIDILPQFLLSLREFAINISKYDAPLKFTSPIGALTWNTRIGKYINLADAATGHIQSSIVAVMNEYFINNEYYLEDIPLKLSTANYAVNHEYVLTDSFVNEVIDELNTVINQSDVIKNTPNCSEFLTKIQQLDASKIGKISFIINKTLNDETGLDSKMINGELMTKLFDAIVKNINLIAGKCFEIPYLTYGNNEKVRALIEKIRTQDVEKDDLDIFFLFFSVVYNDGKKDTIITNASSLKTLDSSKLPSTRINLKKISAETYVTDYLICRWLPTVLPETKIYLNYGFTDTILENQEPYVVKAFFFTEYNGSQHTFDAELDIFKSGLGSAQNSLQTCLKHNDFSPKESLERGVKTDIKTKLLNFISGKMVGKEGPSEKYVGTLMFDNNNDKENRILRASYNGWKYNKSTGKYEKFYEASGKMIEYDPNANADEFFVSQCKALGDKDEMSCTQLMEKILMDDNSSSSIKELLSDSEFYTGYINGRMRDIHPKLAKKILKNLGFKEVQFTTKLGTRVNLIEPYQNWLNRFVRTNKELKGLYDNLVSEGGEELRLFLKLLVKAVNDEKTMSTLSTKEKQEVKADYSSKEEEMRRLKELSEQFGVPVYEGKASATPRLSLEQIKRGFGPEPDIYGPKFDSNLNLLNGYTDFATATMSPFLFLINSQFPGIKISQPYRFTNTRGSMTGGYCHDYDGAEIKVDTAFDLKSSQLKLTWKQLYDELYNSGVDLDIKYVEHINGLIDALECGEASLLLNFSRIKKLSELIKADPSIISDYPDGSDHVFTRDEIAAIAQTFNKKMKDHIERVNKGFDLLSNLKNRSVLGEIEIKDINV